MSVWMQNLMPREGHGDYEQKLIFRAIDRFILSHKIGYDTKTQLKLNI
jgi:hypothetical protein